MLALTKSRRYNGAPTDDVVVLDAHHLGLATIIGRNAEERGRAEGLASANQRMNERLVVVSHELRNFVCVIRHATHLMATSQREPRVVEKSRVIIDRQVGQMARLIDDLLEISQIKSGWLCLQRERVDLRVVARHAIESLEPEIGQREQRLTVALPKAPVWLHADPCRLAQVLVNLLGNAAKYTDKGGELRLSVERDANRATVRVSDSGIGIAADVLPHVFEPFMQAASSLPRAERGIGIGLALVSSLVEVHGGSVTAASAGLGQGSEFTVHLPVVACA